MKLGVFAQKSTFIKIPISFTSLIPCHLPPRDEREMTERTPTQLPANKKCCLLIFAIAIGCLVLADFPASSLPVTLVHPELPFPFLLAVLLCGVPDNACGVFGCTLRFRLRDSPRLYTLHSTPYTAALLPPSKLKMAKNRHSLALLQKNPYLCSKLPAVWQNLAITYSSLTAVKTARI